MDRQHLVVVNSGSSSIKFAIYELNASLDKVLYGLVEHIKIEPTLKLFDQEHRLIKQDTFAKDCDYPYFFERLLTALEVNEYQFNIVAAGHRVVHGGSDYYAPTFVSSQMIHDLKKLIPFAPLHQPYNIEAIETIAHLSPDLPQIACFDTAFHRTHPPVANTFGLPYSFTEEGVRRYGFHGLSYEFIMHQLEVQNIDKRHGRVVVAHLGNGASMCAIKDGKSIDSTMGFTALDGLMMGTRCGNLDPGVILYLLEFKKMSSQEIEVLLYKKSGLLGVSGITSNMQQLLEHESQQSSRALELFVYRIRKELGGLCAALGGLDLLVFTGGIGEHAWQIREAVCQGNEWLGISIDSQRNQTNPYQINDQKSRVDVFTIPTDEEWIIAHHCKHLLNKGI